MPAFRTLVVLCLPACRHRKWSPLGVPLQPVCVCVSECVAIPLMRHTRCDNERYVRDLRLAASAAEAECENTQTDTSFKLQDDTHTPYVWVCRTFNADFLPLPTPGGAVAATRETSVGETRVERAHAHAQPNSIVKCGTRAMHPSRNKR